MRTLAPLGALLLVGLPLTLHGAADERWQINASPYFWAAAASGDVGQNHLPTAELDSSFGDIWRDLDFAMMGIVEARKGRLSLVNDWVYTKLSSSGKTPRGVIVDHVNVKSKTVSALFGAGYALIDAPQGNLDWVLGARVWYSQSRLDFKGGRWDGRGGQDSDVWVNAVTGVRGRYAFNRYLYLTASALAGAGQADLDWEATALLGVQFSQSLSAVVGYRALGVDYSDGGFTYDVVQKGPIAGVVMHF